jgi:hypothetical protein
MAIDFQSSMIIMLQKKITHTVIIKGLFTVALVVLHVTQEWGYGRHAGTTSPLGQVRIT